jgi:hyperosmotically inducible periplasmic protein
MPRSRLVLGTALVALIPAVACGRADTAESGNRARAALGALKTRAVNQMTDRWLTTKIQAQYLADADINARDLDISTRSRVVTLAGTVDTDVAREQAVAIAKTTDGVARVDDRLAVRSDGAVVGRSGQTLSPDAVGTAGTQPPAVAMDDGAITTRIQAKYFLDDSVKPRRIDVQTRNGVVTLHGTVANDNERAQALLLAWTTQGVQHVEDALTVDAATAPSTLSAAPAPSGNAPVAAPSVAPSGAPSAEPSVAPNAAPSAARTDTSLADQVRSRLQADAQARAGSVQITARAGVVLLDGTMPSAASKQRAVSLARSTEGVVQVVDRIRVGKAK